MLLRNIGKRVLSINGPLSIRPTNKVDLDIDVMRKIERTVTMIQNKVEGQVSCSVCLGTGFEFCCGSGCKKCDQTGYKVCSRCGGRGEFCNMKFLK